MFATGCKQAIALADDRREASSSIVARQESECATVPKVSSGAALFTGEWPVWWLGKPRVTATSGNADLVLRAFLNDPSFLEESGTARASLVRIKKSTVEIIGSPQTTLSRSWWPLASVVAGDTVHVVWRDSTTNMLMYAAHEGGRWTQVEKIPGSDSLQFDQGRTGALTTDSDGVVIVARPGSPTPTTLPSTGTQAWRILRRRDSAWSISSVPAWKREPFYFALTHEPSGTSLVGLAPALPGFAWAAQFLPDDVDRVAPTMREYSLGKPRAQSAVMYAGSESGTLLVSATMGSANAQGAGGKTLLVANFVAAILQQVDSLPVASDLALYDIQFLDADQPTVFAVFSNGTAIMYAARREGNDPSDSGSLKWTKHRLPGVKHIAMPVVKRFGSELWMYASEVSEAGDHQTSATTVVTRAYQISCNSLP